MNVPDLQDYSAEEQEILAALLTNEGLMAPSASLEAGACTNLLGADWWCRIKCIVKSIAAAAVCAKNPVCLAGVAAELVACLREC